MPASCSIRCDQVPRCFSQIAEASSARVEKKTRDTSAASSAIMSKVFVNSNLLLLCLAESGSLGLSVQPGSKSVFKSIQPAHSPYLLLFVSHSLRQGLH